MLANIEELERLQPLLRQARDEDKSQVEAACKEQAASEARAAAGESSASKIAELEAVGPLSCLWHVTPQVRLLHAEKGCLVLLKQIAVGSKLSWATDHCHIPECLHSMPG